MGLEQQNPEFARAMENLSKKVHANCREMDNHNVDLLLEKSIEAAIKAFPDIDPVEIGTAVRKVFHDSLSSLGAVVDDSRRPTRAQAKRTNEKVAGVLGRRV